MARLISLRETGKLNTGIKCQSKSQHIPLREKTMLKGGQYQDRDNGAWLSAGLPALYGPHSNCPWAQLLWSLTHGSTEV
jgi:hypothetical protein